jgi:hypothetical protein
MITLKFGHTILAQEDLTSIGKKISIHSTTQDGKRVMIGHLMVTDVHSLGIMSTQ